MQEDPTPSVGRMRVVKKLAPNSRGAIRLAEKFGETLVCVRHRVDAKAKLRFTTVELLVDRTPIKPKSQKLVSVQIDWTEQTLRRLVKEAGARWDPTARVWRMPKRLAGILRLAHRVERP